MDKDWKLPSLGYYCSEGSICTIVFTDVEVGNQNYFKTRKSLPFSIRVHRFIKPENII